jgi:hypothetical protein
MGRPGGRNHTMTRKQASQHCGLVQGGSCSTDSGDGGTLPTLPLPPECRPSGEEHEAAPVVAHNTAAATGAAPAPDLCHRCRHPGRPLYVVNLPYQLQAGQTLCYMGMVYCRSATRPLRAPSARATPGSTLSPMQAAVCPHVTLDTFETAAVGAPDGCDKEDNEDSLLSSSKGSLPPQSSRRRGHRVYGV